MLSNLLKFTDPDGNTPWLVGALVGGCLDLAIQVGSNLIQGKSVFSEISVSSIMVSAAAGAVGAGLASKIEKLSTLARIGIEVAIDASGSAVGQYVESGSVDMTNVGIYVISGQTIGKFVGNKASAVLSKTNTGKLLSRRADRASRIAKNRKGKRTGRQRARNKHAAGAQNKAIGYIVGRGAAAGGAAAQATSKAMQTGLKKEKEKKEVVHCQKSLSIFCQRKKPIL